MKRTEARERELDICSEPSSGSRKLCHTLIELNFSVFGQSWWDGKKGRQQLGPTSSLSAGEESAMN